MYAELVGTEIREEELPRREMGRLHVERAEIVFHKICGEGVGERECRGLDGKQSLGGEGGAETGSARKRGSRGLLAGNEEVGGRRAAVGEADRDCAGLWKWREDDFF